MDKICISGYGENMQTYVGVSKNRGKTPKMDGLQWKTLLKFMIWGYPYFGNTHVQTFVLEIPAPF